MTDVWFYHLDRKAVDAELPGLLLRGLERGLRMAVVTVSAERVKELSQKLWGLEDVAFIPHGFEGEPNPERQPVYLCTDDEPANDAEYVFYIDGSAPNSLKHGRRASIMFNGQDEAAVDQARGLWRRFKAENATIRYWKQDEDGRWKDQAAQS